MQSEIQKVQHDNYEPISKLLVYICANSIRDRDSKEGIDTFLLSEASSIQKYSFKLKYFSFLYATIAEQFRSSFAGFHFEALPFWNDEKSRETYLASVWRSFFSCEIEVIAAALPGFAIAVVEIVVKEDTAWQNVDLLDRMLSERYTKA